MKIEKEQFLNDLQMARGGLSSKEFLTQSNCFVFREGMVFTFNDEVACRKKCQLTIEGAVQADVLLALLEKIPDDCLDIKKNDTGELVFLGKNKRFKLAMDAEVLLPIEKVTEESPKNWVRLPDNFSDIINNVKDCISKDEANYFSLTCIHFHPDYIEACDQRQLLRWHKKLGHKHSMLVRGEAVANIIGLGMCEITSTPSWIHFKNAKGLIMSCRKFTEDYPDMADVLNVKGSKIKLPKGVIKASERAAIMASEQTQGIDPVLLIDLRPGVLKITGTGLVGVYEELKQVAYGGPPMQFAMSPQLLSHITDNYNDATITEKKLKASGGSGDKVGLWEYVTVLGKPKKAEAKPPKSKTETPEE